MQAPTDEITTMEAMEVLGVSDRSTVVKLVRDQRLTPSRKLPGATGAYLFWRADVQRLADSGAIKLRRRNDEGTPA